ncbi:MAG TPA: iron ABC transporter permease [Casimicrobiaceae bacterium]|nr:iron ABC transporter permease [Casimicrobiaceae bacterium]
MSDSQHAASTLDARERPDRQGTNRALLLLAIVALALIALIALCAGPFAASPAQVADVVWSRLLGHPVAGIADEIVWRIRMPRVALCVLVGGALSASGAAFQHLFRNPLVAPETLGVSTGGALGAAIAITLGAGALVLQIAAFAGGLLAVAAVVFIARRLTGHEPLVTLILTGVVVASLLGAAISLIKFIADPYNQLPAITFWLMGSFAAAKATDVVAMLPAALMAAILLGALAWRINLLALPDDEARALGANTPRLRGVVILAATLASAASVAVSGIIGWVGLVVPHIARVLVGPDFSRLWPLAAVLGAIFMLAIDTLARTLLPVEIPPGVLTAFVGTPVFIALLARTGREA